MFNKKLNIKIKNTNKNVKLPTPSFSKPFDSGIDLRSNHMCFIKPGVITPVHTGLYIELPDPKDTFPFVLEIQIRPRSGLAAKNGITVVNSPGTIDNQYRGEIVVLLTGLKYDSITDYHVYNEKNGMIGGTNHYIVHIGDRIAQAVVAPVLSTNILNIVEVDELNETIRGKDGFGSTGVN